MSTVVATGATQGLRPRSTKFQILKIRNPKTEIRNLTKLWNLRRARSRRFCRATDIQKRAPKGRVRRRRGLVMIRERRGFAGRMGLLMTKR